MGELHDWLKYWRTTISKCLKMHKDSKPHRGAYAELSALLDKIDASAQEEELDATVLWAVKFMHRMHELEKEIGLLVLDKKVQDPRPGGGARKAHK
jgi:hypothetical protein